MSTVSERLAALRSAMRAAGVAAYLIPTGDPHSSEYLPAHYNSREYFSGFTGENSTLVVTLTKSALWADGRFFVQAEKQLAGTEIELMRMGEPGVPTVEQYCADALQEGEKLGLCGLTASCQLVRGLQKVLDPKGVAICTLNLEDELWTENRPPLPATPALGSLVGYATSPSTVDYQPMHVNFGLVPPLDDGIKRGKRDRYYAYAERALRDLDRYLETRGDLKIGTERLA